MTTSLAEEEEEVVVVVEVEVKVEEGREERSRVEGATAKTAA